MTISVQENHKALDTRLYQPSDEEISLSSGDEAEIKLVESEPIDGESKMQLEANASNWEMRESIEITLTAQPEDTVMAEDRTDMPEVMLKVFFFKGVSSFFLTQRNCSLAE